ncbi:TOMM precursor leader peptide-binding protein [Krasilnikovia sp. MM14-A1259]|uniref:TOMM precursor leader peptide-binding protein n=1 Tax=Krasilnikovia sp. MM14-A1259 TaxID=3373539 RepID=UPI00382078F2
MDSIHVIALGDFGTAVAKNLADGRPNITMTDSSGPWPASASAQWPNAAIRILLSWREAPAVADVIDARAADWGTPWFTVTVDHPRLRLGPVVVPGAGACYRCFTRRRNQHERDRASTSAVHDLYDRDPKAGPGGFLPHHVTLAAALAEAQLDRFDAATLDDSAGTVRHYNLLDHQASTATVVGLHGCDRCRPTTQRQDATWAALARDLAQHSTGERTK